MARKILNTTPDPELVAALAALRAATPANRAAAEERVLVAMRAAGVAHRATIQAAK